MSSHIHLVSLILDAQLRALGQDSLVDRPQDDADGVRAGVGVLQLILVHVGRASSVRRHRQRALGTLFGGVGGLFKGGQRLGGVCGQVGGKGVEGGDEGVQHSAVAGARAAVLHDALYTHLEGACQVRN